MSGISQGVGAIFVLRVEEDVISRLLAPDLFIQWKLPNDHRPVNDPSSLGTVHFL